MGVQTRDTSGQGFCTDRCEEKGEDNCKVGIYKEEVSKENCAGEEVHICQEDQARQEITKGSVTTCQV